MYTCYTSFKPAYGQKKTNGEHLTLYPKYDNFFWVFIIWVFTHGDDGSAICLKRGFAGDLSTDKSRRRGVSVGDVGVETGASPG